ncbi:MAG: hypothetical protein R2712_11320 [Vicinamibacterales bacterium]
MRSDGWPTWRILGVVLFWLLDRTTGQSATRGLVALLGRVVRALALTVRLPPVRGFVRTADRLVGEALLGDTQPAS